MQRNTTRHYGNPLKGKKLYYVSLNEYITGTTYPCKSTVICTCTNRNTAEWIKQLIMQTHAEYHYKQHCNDIDILITDDLFYLSDEYRDVKGCKQTNEALRKERLKKSTT